MAPACIDFPERENKHDFRCLWRTFFPNGKMTDRITTSDELGKRVRERRVEVGLTQGELADVAHVSPRFVSELENGKQTAQLAGIQRVLAALGLDLYLDSR